VGRRSQRSETGTPALTLLVDIGIPHTVHSFECNDPQPGQHSDYAVHAAAALGVDAHCVFKTLVWNVDTDMVLALAPATMTIAPKLLAAAAQGKKAHLTDVAAAERASGSVTGAISPLGMRRKLPVFIDQSVRSCPQVYVSAGRRGVEICLSPHDLIEITRATVAALGAVRGSPR